MLTVQLSDEMLELLSRPIEGSGGFQDTLKLLGSRTASGVLSVSKAEGERIVRYVEQYGQGGFQERLQPLADRLKALIDAGQA